MTTTYNERITARLAALAKQRSARPQLGSLPPSTTFEDEVAAIQQQRAVIDDRITAIHIASAALASIGSDEADVKWRDFLTTARATLGTELLTIKLPSRDKGIKARAESLEWSIALVDRGLGVSTITIVNLSPTPIGQLMRDAGYATEGPELRGPSGWRGSMKEVERRIEQFAKRRADAQAALDEALIDDDARARRDAEDAAQREVLHTMRIKRDGTGENFVAFTTDGDPLDVADMTATQRAAFERFGAAHATATA